MRIKIFYFTICIIMFGAKAEAQFSTNYWFEGNIYTTRMDEEKRYPYLPVYLSLKESPDDMVAVGMSNSVGVISFKGVPIDISKDYIVSLPFGDKEVKYCFYGIKNPSFKAGNVSIHMKLDEDMPDYYTSKEFVIEDKEYSLGFIDWAIQHNDVAYCEHVFIDRSKQLGFRIFVNGMMLPDDKLQTLLKQLSMDMVKKVTIIYLNDSDYFAGAIDIRLSMGDIPSVSKTTFTLNKINF